MKTTGKAWGKRLTAITAFFVCSIISFGQSEDMAMASNTRKNIPIVIKGKVYHYDSHKPMLARIVFEDQDKGDKKAIMTDGQTGAYEIIVQGGEYYNVRVSAVGHEPLTQYINTTNMQSATKIETDYYIVPEK